MFFRVISRQHNETRVRKKRMMTKTFEVEGKRVDVFGIENTKSPLVILNTYSNEGEAVFNEATLLGAKTFTLAAISKLDWNKDMSPWENPAIYKNDEQFLGKADEYLGLLCSKIIPQVLENLCEKPAYIAIAGYSLGGLFALYASYKTTIFSKIASASASLWFPRFLDFAKSEQFQRKSDAVYLSLGDTEAKVKNKTLASVQENTQMLFEYLKSKEVKAIFELNKGNHFTDCDKRMAKGIKWILEN